MPTTTNNDLYPLLNLSHSQHSSMVQTLINARDMFGLSAEYICTFLKDAKSTEQHHIIYAFSKNFFQMENQINLQLQLLNIDTQNYQYNLEIFNHLQAIDLSFNQLMSQYRKEVELQQVETQIDHMINQQIKPHPILDEETE